MNEQRNEPISQAELARRCEVGRRRIETAIQRGEISADCIGMTPQGVAITHPAKAEAQLRRALMTPRSGRPSKAFTRAQEAQAGDDHYSQQMDLLVRRTFMLEAARDAIRILNSEALETFWQGVQALPDELVRCFGEKRRTPEDLRKHIDRTLVRAMSPLVEIYRNAEDVLNDWARIQDFLFPEPYSGADPAGDIVRKHIVSVPREEMDARGGAFPWPPPTAHRQSKQDG